MIDFLELEVTDYFFEKNKHTKETVEPLMNICLKSKDNKSNNHEINIISNDVVEFERKTFILINIVYKLNNVTQFNKIRKVEVPIKNIIDSEKLYYSVYLKFESELMKVLKNKELIIKMNKYFIKLLSYMIKESTNKNKNDYFQGIIVNDNAKFVALLFNENKIDSIMFNTIYIHKNIFNKQVYYILDLKSNLFVRHSDEKIDVIHLKENKLINLLSSEIKENKEKSKESKEIKNKMQIFLNELLYFYDESSNKESYLLIISNILKQIKS